MAAVPEDIKMLIRAVLASKDGGVLETQFRSDFRKVANEFLEHNKYGYGSMKQLMLSLPDVVRVEFDTRHNVDRYIGVPKPGQFLSKPAQKAMRLNGSDSDGEEGGGNKRRRGGHRNRSSGGSHGGRGDASSEHKRDLPGDLKSKLVGSQNEKGQYALCFPLSYVKKYGDATVRSDFNAAGFVDEENTCGSYAFVRYRSLQEAHNAVEMWAVKYDLRIPTDRLKVKRQTQKSASKPKSPKKNKIVPGRISGPENSLTRAAKPGPQMPLATEHDLDPDLPIVCIRDLPEDSRKHALMTLFGIQQTPGQSLFSKKFKQSIAFVAFPDDDMCGETAARNFIKRFQGLVIGGAPISLSMVSGGVSSSSDTATTASLDTMDMESLQSVLLEESQSDTSSVTSKSLADVDTAIISCQVRTYRYGQPDGAESNTLAGPPGLEEGDDCPPGIEMEAPPGLEEDAVSDIGSTNFDILIMLKLAEFPYHTTAEELLTILRPFGVHVVRIINSVDYYHSTKALIEVTMHQAHRIVQALDNSTFKNRLLKVSPDGASKMKMLAYAKMVDPDAFPENTPTMFHPSKLEQLMSECGTFKFLAGSIDVNTRMSIFVTHVERENNDYMWAVKTSDYAGLTSLDNSLQKFRSDRESLAQRGLIRDSTNNWHRVWVNLILPDDYLYVISVDRGRPFTVKRSNYMYLPDSFWNAGAPFAGTPFVIPMKICERRRSDLQILANNGVYHVQPVDLIDNVLYVAV